MSNQPAENIHDKFFRETFAEPKMAAEFLRHYLPPDLAASLDLDRLEVLKDSFVAGSFDGVTWRLRSTHGRMASQIDAVADGRQKAMETPEEDFYLSDQNRTS